MSFRISTHTIHSTVSQVVQDAQQRVLLLQHGLADGKAIRRPSDDPVGAHIAMRYRERLRANGQYQKSLSLAMSHLNATDSAHFAMEDLLSRARSIAITGANDSNSGEARRALAMEVDQIIQSAADLGNRRFEGAYIFGGTQTLEPPYTVAMNGEGLVQSVTVNPLGIDKPVLRQVGRDVSLSIHVSGDDVFGENQEAFQNLLELREALLAEDVPKIQSMQVALETDQTRTVGSHTLVGSLIRRSETLQTRLLDDEIANESGRSQVEDLDIGRAMLEFNQAQTALEAALNAGSKILESSLLRYL